MITDKLRKIPLPERNLYAIGDIHGCYNELRQLLSMIDFDLEKDQLVFIGDYIDRGPDSKAVVDYLIEIKKTAPNTVFLRGNHEDMMLSFLGYEGNYGESWYLNGSRETTRSYSGDKYTFREDIKKHLDFFLHLEYWVQCGKFIFVHAGLNPYDSLENQDSEDLLWIREPFLQSESPFSEYTIVHGHTPFKEVHFDTNKKIGLDTGCVFGGKLSCVECKSGTVIQVKSNYEYKY